MQQRKANQKYIHLIEAALDGDIKWLASFVANGGSLNKPFAFSWVRNGKVEFREAVTLLWVAALFRLETFAVALLKAGADANIYCRNTWETPLHVLSKTGYHDSSFVRVLLTHGANPFLRDKEGRRAWCFTYSNLTRDVTYKNTKEHYLENIQGPLILLLTLRGLKAAKAGICCGLTQTAVEAMLIPNGLQAFEEDVHEACELLQKAKDIAEIEAYSNKKFFIMDKQIEKRIKKRIRENLLNMPISLRLRARCDKIEVFQRLSSHKELHTDQMDFTYTQSARDSALLVESIDLEERGGRIGVHRFSGIYHVEELTLLLQSLRFMLMSADFPCAIALHVSAYTSERGSHAVALGFDFEQARWIYVNADLEYIANDKQMAMSLLTGFRATNCIAMSGRIYATAYNSKEEKLTKSNSNAVNLAPFIYRWVHSVSYQSVHAITKEKALLVDDHFRSWKELAGSNAEIDTWRRLNYLEQGLKAYAQEMYAYRHWFLASMIVPILTTVIFEIILRAMGSGFIVLGNGQELDPDKKIRLRVLSILLDFLVISPIWLLFSVTMSVMIYVQNQKMLSMQHIPIADEITSYVAPESEKRGLIGGMMRLFGGKEQETKSLLAMESGLIDTCGNTAPTNAF